MSDSKSVVGLLVRGAKIDVAVALDSDIAVNSPFGFRYLLVDSAQAASSPIMGLDQYWKWVTVFGVVCLRPWLAEACVKIWPWV